jgi:hypothetical protein
VTQQEIKCPCATLFFAFHPKATNFIFQAGLLACPVLAPSHSEFLEQWPSVPKHFEWTHSCGYSPRFERGSLFILDLDSEIPEPGKLMCNFKTFSGSIKNDLLTTAAQTAKKGVLVMDF